MTTSPGSWKPDFYEDNGCARVNRAVASKIS